jgi:hypothetical protein
VHFSPLFQQIDFHVNGIHAPDEFLILDRLKTAVANRDFALQFLDCFFPSVLTRIPQIGSIQFYGGVKFSLSVVDAALMRHFVALATPGKAPERRPAEVATAITDAFKLRTRYTHFPSSAVLAPTPVESASSGLTLKKLEEHKAFHDFLFTCAGGLRHFHTVVAALKSTVTLRYRSLGRRLFLADAACNPAEYIERQHRLYVASLAQIFVRNTLRDFIVTRGCADFDSGFLAQIFLRINAAMQQETNPADAILVATTDYINEWKARMNAEFPGSQAASLPSRDVDYPFCQYFVDGVASTGLGLLMDRLSAMDINIVPDVTLPPEGQTLLEHRASLLDSFVRANTVSNLCAGLGNDGWEAPPVKRAIESAKALQFLLCSAERAFREHFVQLKEKKGTGDALLLFLQAEKWLRPRMECDPFKTDSEGRRLLLASLMERVEPLYIRANLLRGLIVLRSIRDNRMPGLERLNAAGNPITDEVNTAFENLRNWFGINPSITYP